jgi:hypothetical protein
MTKHLKEVDNGLNYLSHNNLSGDIPNSFQNGVSELTIYCKLELLDFRKPVVKF